MTPGQERERVEAVSMSNEQLRKAVAAAASKAREMAVRAKRAGWSDLCWEMQPSDERGIQTSVLRSGTKTLALLVCRFVDGKYQVAAHWVAP